MFRIAICDEDDQFREIIQKILTQYRKDSGIWFEMDSFRSGKEFEERGIALKYQVIFFDVNMDGVDGLATAKRIRDSSREGFLVFITASKNYALDGYKVGAVRYILKNDAISESIYECMDAIREKMEHKTVWKEFHFVQGCRKIPLDCLVYIESHLHQLEFYVQEEELRSYTMPGILNKLEEELAEYQFLRVHQSFLVNMRFIKSISRYRAELNNGMRFGIPKARYKEAQERFSSYQWKH